MAQDPIDEFIALPRDQQMATLQSLTPEKQKRLLGLVKQRRSRPAPKQKGPLPSGPEPQQIIQQMTGITPPKTTVGSVVGGIARPIGAIAAQGTMLGPVISAPDTPQEMKNIARGGGGFASPESMGGVAQRMFIDEPQEAVRQGEEYKQRSRTLLESARLIEANAGTPEGRAMLKKRWSQMNFDTEKDARQQASGLRWRAIRDYGNKVLSDIGSVPILGGLGRTIGERWASGDPVGATTEAATNAVLTVDPHLPGKESLRLGPAPEGSLRVSDIPTKAAEWTLNTLGDLPGAPRRMAQFASGVPSDIVRRAERDEGRRFEGDQEKAKVDDEEKVRSTMQDMIDASNAHAEQMRKYNQDIQDLEKRNQDARVKREEKVQKVRDENTEEAAQHQGKVDKATKDWEALHRAHTEGQDALAERTQIRRSAYQRIQDLHDAVKTKVDDMWKKLDNKMGDASTTGDKMTAAIEKAKTKLQGSESSTKELDGITRSLKGTGSTFTMDGTARSMGFKDFAEMQTAKPELVASLRNNPEIGPLIQEAETASNAPVAWRDLRGYYSELGRKLYENVDSTGRGSLPGDVRLALKTLRDSLGDMMGGLAESKDALSDWAETKAANTKFMDTFHDPRSPVGRAYGAASGGRSEAAAMQPFTTEGVETDEAFQNLRSYNPGLANDLLRLQEIHPTARAARTRAQKGKGGPGPQGPWVQEKVGPTPVPRDSEAEVPPAAQEDPDKVEVPQLRKVKAPDFKPPDLLSLDPRAVREQALEASAAQSTFLGQGTLYFYATGISGALGYAIANLIGSGHEAAALVGGAGAGVVAELIRRWTLTKLDTEGALNFLGKPQKPDLEYMEKLRDRYPEAASKLAEQIEALKKEVGPGRNIKIDPRLAQWLGRAAVVKRGQRNASEDEKRARETVKRLGVERQPQPAAP